MNFLHVHKRALHHWLRNIQRLKVWQLLVLLIIASFISATLLRLNNIGMVERRQAVYAADEKGDSVEIRNALAELQRYVGSHMNTGLDKGVYLQKSYDRAREAALATAGTAANPNSAIYQQASIECRSRFVGGVQSFRNDYVQCVIEKVASLTQGGDPLGSLNHRAQSYIATILCHPCGAQILPVLQSL
jgi:hypothetical protein